MSHADEGGLAWLARAANPWVLSQAHVRASTLPARCSCTLCSADRVVEFYPCHHACVPVFELPEVLAEGVE